MGTYLLKRLLLIIPTLIGIMADQLRRHAVRARRTGRARHRPDHRQRRVGDRAHRRRQRRRPVARPATNRPGQRRRRGLEISRRAGLDPEFIKQLEKQFGFDKPAHERFFLMMKNYAVFDFGKSYFRDVSVLELIMEKMPVSISLGIWMTLLTYLISIPLGIRKAVRDGAPFDTWTSGAAGRRLRRAGLPRRRPAARRVRRRLVLPVVPVARADIRQLGPAQPRRQGHRLLLAHRRCRSSRWRSAPSRP